MQHSGRNGKLHLTCGRMGANCKSGKARRQSPGGARPTKRNEALLRLRIIKRSRKDARFEHQHHRDLALPVEPHIISTLEREGSPFARFPEIDERTLAPAYEVPPQGEVDARAAAVEFAPPVVNEAPLSEWYPSP